MTNTHQCIHEERFSNIEKDLAEVTAKLENKKDNIYTINKELLNEREQLTSLLKEVTELKVLIEQSQIQRLENNNKLNDAEKKIDKLQTDVTSLASSLNALKTVVIVAVPIISIIVTIALHFLGA